MKHFELTAGGKNFSFICASRNTQHGFAHDCELTVNGCFAQKASCFYLNRTWECWQYQSVCLKAVDNEIEWYKKLIRNKYKERKNLTRITAKRLPEIENLCNNDEYLQALIGCYEALKNRRDYL